MYTQYQSEGLRVLAFPCNQFGKQEPGTDAEIKQRTIKKYGITFDLFHKIDVNGPKAIPLYKFLKSELPGAVSKSLEWNFVKFLIDRNGVPYRRFSPDEEPISMTDSILWLLKGQIE
ncbi:unnamed protein product [Calicophoron daubneyi]|uniref:Glutathione peroxidase n=1 Tax=Calicophoron daubneyi TaxID=300641 RepID=A0AAV2T5T7_CALDB